MAALALDMLRYRAVPRIARGRQWMTALLGIRRAVFRLHFGIVAPDDYVGVILLGHAAPPCMLGSAD